MEDYQNPGEIIPTGADGPDYAIVDPEMDPKQSGNMKRLIDLVGPQIRKSLLIYELLSIGFVMTDELSQVLWVSNRFTRSTGWDITDLQSKGLEILLPTKYHNFHQRWVKEFTDDFRAMNDRGPIAIPCKDSSSINAILQIASFTLSVGGEYRHFRVAILQAKTLDEEKDFITQRIENVSTAIRSAGSTSILLLIGLIVAWSLAANASRLIRIGEEYTRNNNEKLELERTIIQLEQELEQANEKPGS